MSSGTTGVRTSCPHFYGSSRTPVIVRSSNSLTMPAQSGDPISSALHLSLSSQKNYKAGEDLDSRLTVKTILQSEIKYIQSNCTNDTLSEFKSRYIVLHTVPISTKSEEVTSTKECVVSDVSTPKKLSVGGKEPTALPAPKRVLYSPENVRLGWCGPTPIGSGFVNLGNTCYLNSSLQALFHVPAFVNWLLSDVNHSLKCESMNGMTHSECLICAMSKTLQASQKCTNSVVKPFQIYSKLRAICKHLTHGHQEDAHEFLRYLIEGMERSYLLIFNGIKLDNYSKETTPLSQIFGGYLRSEVTCLECQHVSTTFQHFQDLLLDIRTASSVDDALESYFSRERLGDGDQAYRCEQCKRRVAATKKFSIERPPKVLCIALKRFGAMGGKNSKTISMKQILEISKFRHRPSGDPCTYKLVSMVTHLGPSSSCGHYTAVGQAANGSYYLFDDTIVRAIPVQNVLNSNPYILMYEMETESKKPAHLAPKKEIVSNGLGKSNGFSNSTIESKSNMLSNSTINSHSSGSATASTSCEMKPAQNGPKVKWVNFERTSYEAPAPATQEKLEPSKPLLESQKQQTSVRQQTPSGKDAGMETAEKTATIPNKGVRTAISASIDKFYESKASPSKLPTPSPSHRNHTAETMERVPGASTNGTGKALLCTPEKKVTLNQEENKSNPAARCLVPYDSDQSSDEDFALPKTSSSKDSSKPFGGKNSGRSSPQPVQNVKGVMRIVEVEGTEPLSNHLPGHNRPDLHSPAGSTSSGKWSVTSAEREKTPEKQEKHFKAIAGSESQDKMLHTSYMNGIRTERWNGSRNDNSTMEHLLKNSHLGYGAQVPSWNGNRSEMNQQVENERNVLKRSYDLYNDDIDRARPKKMKFHSPNSYDKYPSDHRHQKFQQHQNWKNNLSQRQRYFRNYTSGKKNRYYNHHRNNYYDS